MNNLLENSKNDNNNSLDPKDPLYPFIPFYLSQYTNDFEGTYYSDINYTDKAFYPLQTVDKFYAISPYFLPIPAGTKMYYTERNLAFPFNTTDFDFLYDFTMFYQTGKTEPNKTHLITYDRPFMGLTTLYFHVMIRINRGSGQGKNVYISFEKEGPFSKYVLETREIYVIRDIKDAKDTKDFKFIPVNAVCLPASKELTRRNNLDVYNYTRDKNIYSFIDCVKKYNIDVKDPLNRPHALLTNIENKAIRIDRIKNEKSNKKDGEKDNNYIIPLVSTFIIFIFITIIIFLK